MSGPFFVRSDDLKMLGGPFGTRLEAKAFSESEECARWDNHVVDASRIDDRTTAELERDVVQDELDKVRAELERTTKELDTSEKRATTLAIELQRTDAVVAQLQQQVYQAELDELLEKAAADSIARHESRWGATG